MRNEPIDQNEPAGEPVRLLTPRFALLLFGQACFGYAFSTFFLLPKYLSEQLGAGPAAIGALNAAHSAAAVVMLILTGMAVDRYGRRRFLTAGALLMAASTAGFLFVDDIGPLIYGLRIAQGIAFGVVFVSGAALTIDQAPSERLSQAIGLFGLTMLSMNAVAPPTVEAIAHDFGWPLAFATAAIGAAACALCSLFLREHVHPSSQDASPVGLLAVALRPEQIRAAIVIALVGSCFGCLFVFGQLKALEVGMPDVHSLFVGYACAAAFARLVLGHAGDRYGRIRVALAMLVLYGVGTSALLAVERVGLIPIGLVFGLAHGLFYPTYNASVVDGAPPSERGRIVALFQGWFNVGMAGGSLAFGWLAEWASLDSVFVAAAAGIVLAFVVLATERGVTPGLAISRAAPDRTP